jgi:hypothetical protein
MDLVEQIKAAQGVRFPTDLMAKLVERTQRDVISPGAEPCPTPGEQAALVGEVLEYRAFLALTSSLYCNDDPIEAATRISGAAMDLVRERGLLVDDGPELSAVGKEYKEAYQC